VRKSWVSKAALIRALYGFTVIERNRLTCELKMCCLWGEGPVNWRCSCQDFLSPNANRLLLILSAYSRTPSLHHSTQCNPPFQSTWVSGRLGYRVFDCLIISSLRSEAAIPDCLTGKRNITSHKPSIPPLVLDPSCKTRFVALQYIHLIVLKYLAPPNRTPVFCLGRAKAHCPSTRPPIYCVSRARLYHCTLLPKGDSARAFSSSLLRLLSPTHIPDFFLDDLTPPRNQQPIVRYLPASIEHDSRSCAAAVISISWRALWKWDTVDCRLAWSNASGKPPIEIIR